MKELLIKNEELNLELTRTENEKTKNTYLSQDQTATLLQDLVRSNCTDTFFNFECF